jgi:1,4-alpha-glucan branching enzyme
VTDRRRGFSGRPCGPGTLPPVSADPRWGEMDRFLFNEGRHWRLWEHLGAHVGEHRGAAGTWFAVWAPDASHVAVVGDFNGWNEGAHPMAPVHSTGVWSAFVPGAGPGQAYKYAVTDRVGVRREKADPLARRTELPPRTASVIDASVHQWGEAEQDWVERRRAGDPWGARMSVYEVHLGSWRAGLGSWAAIAGELARHVADLGFTHVELLPVAEHPYGPSWGYQVSGYYAPTARFGTPDECRAFVETMHRHGLGVIVDWVPAHFPKDDWSLGRFDGTALYEHADPREGEHPDWGTYVFNLGRHEVRNFLIANALYWIDEFHVDGLRVDAVASMLYRDYSRRAGEWIPNVHGGRENLEAVSFLRELNTVVHAEHPGVLMVAEESTAWPGVSRPVEQGGLGFGFKWNMGWMHDTLEYFSRDPVHRRFHHHELTFGLLYAFTENFVLPLSHDEVVHGKGSLIARMPGDAWQQRANLRALYAWMWAHPGKQLVFMGAELGQWGEWNSEGQLDWWLLDDPAHRGIHTLVRDLNRLEAQLGALTDRDFDARGFQWIVGHDADASVYAFARWSSRADAPPVACLANLTPVPRAPYGLHLPLAGRWDEVLNTDASIYGGSGVGNLGGVDTARDGYVEVTLPPLSVVWLAHRPGA